MSSKLTPAQQRAVAEAEARDDGRVIANPRTVRALAELGLIGFRLGGNNADGPMYDAILRVPCGYCRGTGQKGSRDWHYDCPDCGGEGVVLS